MMWLAFARRCWRVLAIAAAVGLLLVLLERKLDAAYEHGYEAARADYAAQLAEANARQAARDAQVRKAFQAKESRWIGERSALQNQITDLAGRVQPVRLCKPIADRREVPGAVAAASSAARASEPRFSDLPDGYDAGPGLVQLAGECEGYRLRLIELQSRWP